MLAIKFFLVLYILLCMFFTFNPLFSVYLLYLDVQVSSKYLLVSVLSNL